jgi:hypothetical protein
MKFEVASGLGLGQLQTPELQTENSPAMGIVIGQL